MTAVSSEGQPIRVAVIGSGPRARMFIRVLRLLDPQFAVVALVRSAQRARQIRTEFDVPVSTDLGRLLSVHAPDFAVVAVSPDASASVVARCAAEGLPVLAETPPADSLDELVELLALERAGLRIQVAEQCQYRPLHQARKAVVDQGRLGPVSYVHSSAAHGYHGVNLIRDLLGINPSPATVTARSIPTPLRYGGDTGESPPDALYGGAHGDNDVVVSTSTIVAHLDYGRHQATYEFSFDQYFTARRGDRLLVRGERGDLVDDRVLCLPDGSRGESHLRRVDEGSRHDVSRSRHIGYTLDGAWAYRNPFAIAGLADDDIAVATCLTGMARFVQDGTPFSTLADAAHDRAVDLAIQAAAKHGTTEPVDPRFTTASIEEHLHDSPSPPKERSPLKATQPTAGPHHQDRPATQ